MSIQLNEENGAKVLVMHVSGKLTTADYEHFVPVFERLVRQTIRYFDYAEAAEARRWLGEA